MFRRSRHSARTRRRSGARSHYAPTPQSSEHGRFHVPVSASMPKRVFVICHYCGDTPDGGVPDTGVCPKCLCSSWERFALPEPLIPAHMK